MKKLIYSILSVVAVIILHASCMDEHDDPVIDYNEDANVTVTTTIKALKDKYADVVSANGLQLIEEDDTIFAVVVGNDESGNIYKQLFVQDETGGICISVDINNMNTDYCVGQRVAIYLKGLYIGGYGELAQIGVPYTDEGETEPQIGRMSKFVWEAHSERIGEARPEYLPEPTVITSAEQFTDDMLSTLVSLQGMHFDNPGIFTFADFEADEPATESKTMYFTDNTEVTVRTSRYGSGLAQMVIPGGVGTFNGILTTYRGEWQITARTADDVEGFEFYEIPNTFIKETFSEDLGVFTSYSAAGHATDIEWIIDYSSACVKGYVDGNNVDAVTYLVSQPVNLSTVDEAYVTFEHAINYANSSTLSSDHQLLVSSDFAGDVDAATWTVIPIKQADGGSFTFYSSGRAIVPDEYIADGVVFALRHTSRTSRGSTWEVRNFAVVDGVGEEIKDMTDPTGALLYQPFSELGQGDFEIVDIEIPNVEVNDTWYHNSRYGMVVSGYDSESRTNYPNEDWLISPSINTTGTNAILTFRHAINFAGSAENRRACCRVYVSTSYAGDGVINESDWTQVEITYPSSDGWGFVSAGEIELPQSENLRVAFRYTCEDHDAPTWEVDEFMVK